MTDPGTPAPDAPGADPRAPLGHLSRLGFALLNASDVDEVVRGVLIDLVMLPDVSRVGVALTEGAGRQLRFVSTDGTGAGTGAGKGAGKGDGELVWCHIDAYDDVPLTTVARTGEPVFGSLDELESRYPDVVAGQRELGTRAMAVWPLPGIGSPIGGIIVFFDADQTFPEVQRRLLEAAARRTSDAVRRVRITAGRGPGELSPNDPALIGEGQRASVLLESDPRSPGTGRRFLREQLAEWGVDDDAVDTAQLCLSELVTNAVMHARTASELTVHLEQGDLTVVVRDLGGSGRSGGPASHIPVTDDEDPLRVFGRGLTLVDALADRWGSEQDGAGTTAWFVLALDDPPETSAKTG